MPQNNQSIGNISNSTVIGNNVSGNGVNIHHNTLSEDIVESIKQLQKQNDSLIFIINKFSFCFTFSSLKNGVRISKSSTFF